MLVAGVPKAALNDPSSCSHDNWCPTSLAVLLRRHDIELIAVKACDLQVKTICFSEVFAGVAGVFE